MLRTRKQLVVARRSSRRSAFLLSPFIRRSSYSIYHCLLYTTVHLTPYTVPYPTNQCLVCSLLFYTILCSVLIVPSTFAVFFYHPLWSFHPYARCLPFLSVRAICRSLSFVFIKSFIFLWFLSVQQLTLHDRNV